MELNFNLDLKKEIIKMHNMGYPPGRILHNIDPIKWDMGVINTTRIKNAIKHAKKYSYLGKVR